MALRVFDTKRRAAVPFTTKRPNEVRMYVCGPTVYERAHLGHARSYVIYDVMRRYFESRGFAVEHVQNFTDIEESVYAKAQERGVPPLVHADEHITAFLSDMDALRVLRAHAYPRVSEHIPDVVQLIQDLMAKGIAYRVDCHPGTHQGDDATVCDIYFDVEKTRTFGSLIGQRLEDFAVDGFEERGDRRHPLDFALWKSRADWGVTFPSPWGDGRPGWHVECSAMALKHLGSHFDLHGGGLDLVFPHHDSEQTIAEAVTGATYVTHFVHNGFVTVNDRKMSKSTGNFVVLEELLAKYGPETLRVFLLSEHYRHTLDYDTDAIEAAAARAARWQEGLRALVAAAGTTAAGALGAAAEKSVTAFWDAMEDDFHTDRALDAFEALLAAAAGTTGAEAAAARDALRDMANVLGVAWDLESQWAPSPPLTVPDRAPAA